MKNYKWISSCGDCDNESIQNVILDYLLDDEKRYVAYYTDKFDAGYINKDNIEIIRINNLLELRIFSLDSELKIFRLSIGEEFSYRVIDDNYLEKQCKNEKELFLQDAKHFYVDHYQLLDINEKISKSKENRNYILWTTVGGRYKLPINENDKYIKTRCYLIYSDKTSNTGMANIIDYRYVSFEQKGENDDE